MASEYFHYLASSECRSSEFEVRAAEPMHKIGLWVWSFSGEGAVITGSVSSSSTEKNFFPCSCELQNLKTGFRLPTWCVMVSRDSSSFSIWYKKDDKSRSAVLAVPPKEVSLTFLIWCVSSWADCLVFRNDTLQPSVTDTMLLTHRSYSTGHHTVHGIVLYDVAEEIPCPVFMRNLAGRHNAVTVPEIITAIWQLRTPAAFRTTHCKCSVLFLPRFPHAFNDCYANF